MSIVIIPARLGSTRLPRKSVLDETGKPLICHAVDRALESSAKYVIIASEDQEILDVVENQKRILKCLTPKCDSGTERVCWTVLNSSFGIDADIIINLQGDEPELPGRYLDEMVDVLISDNTADIVTIATPASDFDYKSHNVVKVVVTHNGYAMYFSRCSIPYGTIDHNALKHIGTYAYRREFFLALQRMESTTLACESLEQLQWLQSGFRIKVLQRNIEATGIDTRSEYDAFVQRWLSR